MAPIVSISDIAHYDGQQVTVRGWLYLKREKGRLIFLLVRDGSGLLQSVVFQPDVPAESFAAAQSLTQESSLIVSGQVRAEPRAPGGFELAVSRVEPVQITQDYPITPK